MVNHGDKNIINQGGWDKNPSSVSKGGGGGATRSCGTTISGQSISTSGSVGSPSSRSETAGTTPTNRMNNLDIQGNDAGSRGTAGNKKKRSQRAVGGDKSGRGLRQFSMKVCKKVESKGRTTYNEVADELVAEFSDPDHSNATPDQQQYDEKNIRRRVYDALNVLMAMDIISKDKKEIQWKGLPRTSLNDVEELKNERLGFRNRIEKKVAYLAELEEQYLGLQNLVQRNEQQYGLGNAPSGGVALPFIMVQTGPNATVEVEISEDMQLVHFDFNSTPFELHDDYYVLKAMKFCDKTISDMLDQNLATDGGTDLSIPNTYASQITHSSRSNFSGMPAIYPPLPGILKSRVKHEH